MRCAGNSMVKRPILSVQDLRVSFGASEAVRGVSFEIAPGETLGLVGESGSGKSVTSMAIMRLLPSPPWNVSGTSVMFQGKDLLTLGFSEMRHVRGAEISMVFQDPMT